MPDDAGEVEHIYNGRIFVKWDKGVSTGNKSMYLILEEILNSPLYKALHEQV